MILFVVELARDGDRARGELGERDDGSRTVKLVDVTSMQ